MLVNLVFSLSVYALVSFSDSYATLISAPVWSAVAPVSIAFNLVNKASVNALASASYRALISAPVWSSAALVSIVASFVNNASVNAFVSASYRALISAPVWSSVAPVSIALSLDTNAPPAISVITDPASPINSLSEKLE